MNWQLKHRYMINTHRLTTENEKLMGLAEKQKLKLNNNRQKIINLNDCISEKDAEIARLRALLEYRYRNHLFEALPVTSATAYCTIGTEPDETINDDTIAIYQQRIKG